MNKTVMATADIGCNNATQCDNCRNTGVLKDAVSSCSECDLHFCVACDTLHGKIASGHKTDRNKNVDTVENKVDETTTYLSCSKHRKETAEYYCQTHESLICKTCNLSEHASCAVQNISDACEETDISKYMSDVNEQLIKLQEATDKLKREKQTTLNAYQSEIDDQKHTIRSLRRKFNDLFDSYDSQLESQETSFVNNLSSSIRTCVKLFDRLKEQTKFLEEKQNGVDKQLFFQQLINAKSMCTEFRSVLREIRSKKVKCDINIKEDKNHQILVDQLSKQVQQVTDSEEVVDFEVGAVDTSEKMKKKSFLNIKSCFTAKETDVRVRNDKHRPYITGCCWLSDGQVALCDFSYNDNIKILDKDFNIKFTAPCPPGPWDIDCIDESSAVVTLPSAKALQFMSVKPGFKFQQKKDLNLCCKGISVHDKNIFVCIDESEPSKKGVKVLNLNGDDVSFISHLGSEIPRSLCVTGDGTKIYYTGGSGKDLFINCVTKDGYGIFSISSSELDLPTGIVYDESSNVMICDENKKCVQIISAEGVCGNILLTEKNDMYASTSMCLSKTYDTLIIASNKDASVSKLTVYKLEYS